MSDAVEQDPGYDVATYFGMVDRGLLEADDHVELLEGLVVASPPTTPLHASVTMCVDAALRKAIGDRASIRIQMPLIVGSRSVPEPHVAVVAGRPADYRDDHPRDALLVVEIASASLPHDRLTKSRIYANAGVPEYWIVNLRDRRLESHVRPDTGKRVYTGIRCYEIGDVIEPASFPGAKIPVADLFGGY